jgi:cytoskeletal protein RodZ
VSIGADLAEARRRAGLTVTQVSQRTCIRHTIITDIERDDYTACGGDFYTRGHIRAIAKVVGADPGPLIGQYDAAHPAVTAPAADRLKPARPVRIRQRQRAPWAMMFGLALVAVLSLVAYHVITAPGHPSSARPVAAAEGHHPAGHHPRPARTAPTAAANPYAHKVAIHLVAIEDCWVEFTTPGGGLLFQSVVNGGTSKRWVFGHAVDMTLGNPGGIRLTVDGKRLMPPGPPSPVTLRLGLGGKIVR